MAVPYSWYLVKTVQLPWYRAAEMQKVLMSIPLPPLFVFLRSFQTILLHKIKSVITIHIRHSDQYSDDNTAIKMTLDFGGTEVTYAGFLSEVGDTVTLIAII